MRILVVTAVSAERDAILAAGSAAGESIAAGSAAYDVIVGGVGPAASAAASAAALAYGGYDLVLSAGIAGGFSSVQVGAIAIASRSVFADLGVEAHGASAEFVPLPDLGFGTADYVADPRFTTRMAELAGGSIGAILTVATVTATAARAAQSLRRHPDAVAEAMEGAGVAAAASLTGTPFGEVRAISNMVGPRERTAWEVPAALAALGRALASITAAEWDL
ncbi:MAG: futalosine hydrolase [Actinomycetota bacterium]|nr:futalosine hydrolase [Actinomycetota bacterium]